MRVYQPYPSYTSAVLVSKETSGKNKSKKEKKKRFGKSNGKIPIRFSIWSSASLDEPRSTVAPTRLTKLRRNVSWGARETCSLILPEWNIHGRVHARRYATKPLCRVSALVEGRSKGGRFRVKLRSKRYFISISNF